MVSGAILGGLALALSGGAAAQDARPWAGRELVVMIEDRAIASFGPTQELARAFEREHPGLVVRVLDQGGAVGQRDKARFLLAGDLQLDVTRIDATEFAAFQAEGALVDLEPFFAADPAWDASRYWGFLDGLRGPDGHLYGLPSTFTPYVMYANLDLLREAGLARPAADWTWDDLVAACRATTRDDDGDGRPETFGVSLCQWLQAVVPWIWQNGGDLLDARGERSRLGEREAVEALAFVRGLLHDERVASFDASFEGQFAQGLFQAGRAAFYGPVGYWETYRFQHIEAFEWDVLPLPRRDAAAAPATSVAMTAYVVPRTSREPELAYAFVRRLGEAPYQRMLASIGQGVPILEQAARSEAFLDPERPPASERVFLDVLPGARLMPRLANWRKIEDLIAAPLAEVLLAEACDVADAGARMAQLVDDHLARERARHALPRLARWSLELAGLVACVGAVAAFLTWRGASRSRLERGEARAGALLLAPWAIGFLVFALGPAAVTLCLSFCEWSPLRGLDDVRFAGAANLARLADDGTFHASLRVTLVYALVSVPLGLALALALALLLRGDSRRTGVARTLVYLPTIVSPVVVAALWRALLDADTGLVNEALARVGVLGPAWLRDPGTVLGSFVLMSLWSVGAQMLVFLAALQALPRELEDAARLDGAGPWARLVHVVLPALSPVVLFNLVLGLLAALQLFAQPYVLTQGGPGDASRFLLLYVYETGFRHLDMGYAATLAWVLFAVSGAIVGLALLAGQRFVHSAARRSA